MYPGAIYTDLSNNPDANKFAFTLASDLEAYLTQTRKFAVLDRSMEEFTNEELQSYKKGNYPVEELTKIGNRVGTEYLAIMVLREFSPRVEGKEVQGVSLKKVTLPVTIDLRIIDVVSGQVKFAHNHSQKGRITKNFGLASFSKRVAMQMGELVNFAIFPITVISRNGDLLTLNQGGETIKIGKSYRLVKLGKRLKDPYTGESLGPDEIDVGVVEIKNRTDRTATAKLVSGFIEEGEVFNTLRIRPMKVKPKILKSLSEKKYLTRDEKKENKQDGGNKDDW